MICRYDDTGSAQCVGRRGPPGAGPPAVGQACGGSGRRMRVVAAGGTRRVGLGSQATFRRRDRRLPGRRTAGPDHKVMETYGAWQQSALGAGPVRSTVPVDPAGTLVHHRPKVIPEGHAERGGVKLAELRARAAEWELSQRARTFGAGGRGSCRAAARREARPPGWHPMILNTRLEKRSPAARRRAPAGRDRRLAGGGSFDHTSGFVPGSVTRSGGEREWEPCSSLC